MLQDLEGCRPTPENQKQRFTVDEKYSEEIIYKVCERDEKEEEDCREIEIGNMECRQIATSHLPRIQNDALAQRKVHFYARALLKGNNI